MWLANENLYSYSFTYSLKTIFQVGLFTRLWSYYVNNHQYVSMFLFCTVLLLYRRAVCRLSFMPSHPKTFYSICIFELAFYTSTCYFINWPYHVLYVTSVFIVYGVYIFIFPWYREKLLKIFCTVIALPLQMQCIKIRYKETTLEYSFNGFLPAGLASVYSAVWGVSREKTRRRLLMLS